MPIYPSALKKKIAEASNATNKQAEHPNNTYATQLKLELQDLQGLLNPTEQTVKSFNAKMRKFLLTQTGMDENSIYKKLSKEIDELKNEKLILDEEKDIFWNGKMKLAKSKGKGQAKISDEDRLQETRLRNKINNLGKKIQEKYVIINRNYFIHRKDKAPFVPAQLPKDWGRGLASVSSIAPIEPAPFEPEMVDAAADEAISSVADEGVEEEAEREDEGEDEGEDEDEADIVPLKRFRLKLRPEPEDNFDSLKAELIEQKGLPTNGFNYYKHYENFMKLQKAIEERKNANSWLLTEKELLEKRELLLHLDFAAFDEASLKFLNEESKNIVEDLKIISPFILKKGFHVYLFDESDEKKIKDMRDSYAAEMNSNINYKEPDNPAPRLRKKTRKRTSEKKTQVKGLHGTSQLNAKAQMTQKIISGTFEQLKKQVRKLQLKCKRTPSEDETYAKLRDRLIESTEGSKELEEFLEMSRTQKNAIEELNKLGEFDGNQSVEQDIARVEYNSILDKIYAYIKNNGLQVYGESNCFDSGNESSSGNDFANPPAMPGTNEKIKRCQPHHTRNKITGVCDPKNIVPNADATTEKIKRCPPHHTRNKKTGVCDPKHIVPNADATTEKIKRCQRDHKRNKKTGVCDPKNSVPNADATTEKIKRCQRDHTRNKITGVCDPKNIVPNAHAAQNVQIPEANDKPDQFVPATDYPHLAELEKREDELIGKLNSDSDDSDEEVTNALKDVQAKLKAIRSKQKMIKFKNENEVKKMYEEIQNKIDVLINKRDNLRVALTDKENKNLREYEDELNYIEQVIEAKKK